MNRNSIPKPADKRALKLAILYSVCGYIIFAGYGNIFPDYGIYNEKRILQVTLLSVINITSLIFFRNDMLAAFAQLPRLSKTFLLILIAIGIISSAINQNHHQSAFEISLLATLFISTLAIAAIYPTIRENFHNSVLLTLLLMTALHFTTASGAYLAAIIEPVSLLPHELFLNFSNVRFFNQLQSWSLPIIVISIFYQRDQKTLIPVPISIFLVTGCWLLLFASGGRGTILGMIVATILTFIIFRAHAKLWIKWQLITSSAALVFYMLLFYSVPSLIKSEETSATGFSALRNAGSSSRDHIWGYAGNLIQDHFLFGIGPYNFACISPSNIPAHPHNAIIQIAVEWGIPAALIIISLLVWGTRSWVVKARKMLPRDTKSRSTEGEHHIFIALFASLTAATTHALFSGITIMPHSQVMMVLIIGWMTGAYINQEKLLPFRGARLKIISLIAMTLFSLLVLVSGMYPGLSIVNLNELIQSQQVQPQSPRFWQQGKLCL